MKMDDTRLPKSIFLQEFRQANSKWSQDIREVFKIQNLSSVYDSKIAVNVRNVWGMSGFHIYFFSFF